VRVCPSVQRALAVPDCTPLMPIKGSNTVTCVFSQLMYVYVFCLLLPLGYVGGE